MGVELRQLRSFVVVAEEGNVGRAAARLFISQPALSRQMQGLEQELGVMLLTRVPRGVELTDVGREVLEKARTVLAATEEILTISRPDEPSGRLLLGLSVAGLGQHWSGLAEAFAADHPRIDVEIHSALSELLQRQVLAGGLDVAIVLEPSRCAGLSYAVLREEPVLAWMHPEHPLTGRAQVTPAEVAAYPVTLVGGSAGRGSGFNATVRRIFADAGCTPDYRQPPDPIPFTAIHDRDAVLVSVCGYADEVRGVPLAGDHTMRYQLIHQAGAAGVAVRAFKAFAARHARDA
jgi:DNA-binding transcriptional LysR family regulator